MKFSVCTDAVFAGVDTVSAMRACKTLGFDAIEFWSWENKDMEAIRQAREELGMTVVTFCTQYSILNDAREHDRYLEGLARSIEWAKRLDTKLLISQVGQSNDLSDAEQKQHVIDGLKRCVPLLEEAGITLAIEPLNTRVDHPGYFMASSDLAADIINQVGSPHVQILYDFYHQQVTEGDIFRRSEALIDRIGHVHIAGNPGRMEPDRGEIDLGHLLAHLDRIAYDGYVGLEYQPQDPVEIGLMQLREFGGSSNNE